MEGLAKNFQPLQFFEYNNQDNPSYLLLPSRFIEIEDKRYLLSNEVGEFLIVDRDQLENYVHKRLKTSDSLYHDLKSKHLLIDDDSRVGLDLMAIKYRTKSQRLSPFTSLHLFVVTLRCDYNCSYCQVSRQTQDKTRFDMSFETADRALEYVFRSPSPTIKIEFQGGEPLLNFPLIRYIVERSKAINASQNREIQYVIASNLSYLDDEILEFCVKHDIFLSTSLDGPPDLHDRNRLRSDRDGFSLTVRQIKKAQRILGKDKVSALMTTTEASLGRVKEIIDVYIELGFEGIFLRPISPYGFAVKTQEARKYDVEQWLKFYKEGLEYILFINRSGFRFGEFYTALFLTKLFSPFGSGYVDLQSPAGIGISAIVYNYDGDVYASDESRMLAEMGDKRFRLGNLHKDSYETMMLSDLLLDTLEQSIAESCPQCSECGFLTYCGSDPVYHHATQGDVIGHKAFSAFCARHMGMLKHLVLLLEKNHEVRSLMLQWIRP